MNPSDCLNRLRAASAQSNLTLYLGPQVATPSGIPDWEHLVAAMYFAAAHAQMSGRRGHPYPNYLLAITEWYLERRLEPIEMTANKLSQRYTDPFSFVQALRQTLYTGYTVPDSEELHPLDMAGLLRTNPILNSIVTLARQKTPQKRYPLRAVLTYNYDNLLEIALSELPHQPIWKQGQTRQQGSLPIYHLRGYLPMQGPGAALSEIVFTEDQFRASESDAYSWANLMQLKYLTSSCGLMIGLPPTDRGLRHLLEAIRKAPIYSENYILLQRPQWREPTGTELDDIHRRARDYFNRFYDSGSKLSSNRVGTMIEIIGDIMESDLKQQTQALEAMGIVPIWYDDDTDLPRLIQSVAPAAP